MTLVPHRSLVVRAAVLVVACACLTGCPSVAREYCERQIEECNDSYFGIRNVDDCTERVEKNLDNLVTSKRQDCEAGIDDCLDKANCQNFQQCTALAVLQDCF